VRFERLEINGFGPLAGTNLDFVPGLNVVYGPNESAKTAIHAALFAGLCGVRRGKGQPAREDKAFQDRHRPWDGGSWEVAAVVELADGRRIRLTHDLADKVACSARDENSGKDVSSSILNDGSIDGSVWLGLNRRSFRATACVRQTEILAALADDADHLPDHRALQEALQKAATSAGQQDKSVGAALDALTSFRTERVGSKTHGGARNRPYQAAKRKVGEAEDALQTAQRSHEEYLKLLVARDAAIRAREETARAVALAEAVVALGQAAELEERAQRAADLQAKYPEQPLGVSGDEELTSRVSSALAVWEAAPTEQDLTGETTEHLEARLAGLPERPEGDMTPAQAVLNAATEVEIARRLQAQELERPAPEEEVPAPAPTAEPATHSWSRARIPMVAVAVLGVAGVAALTLGSPVVGAVLLVGALAAAAATFWFLRPVPTGAAPQTTVTPRVDAGAARRQRLEEHAARVEATERALAEMLESHQVTPSEGETLEQAVERYKAACAAREEQDQAARQRERINMELQQRRGAEQRQAVRKAAGDGVLAAAAAAGLSETDPGAAATALQAWKADHHSDVEGQDAATREWAQLEEVLGGETVESLLESARQARAVADELAVRFSADELDSLTAEDTAVKLPGLRTAHAKALDEAARHEQVAETEAKALHSPAEALAELDEAKDAFDRVEELDETLETTISFLQAAQERVYATIAPALTATVREWLPQVVVVMDGGAPAPRYSDVRVDPETLQVEVRKADGEPWRDADLLSAGTREQVYLLLRAALAEHLVKSGEIAPLLLDEVTAQADSTRRGALLELILELSRNRQIILFTHDDAVAAWAQQRLEPNAVRRLEPIGNLVAEPLTA